MRRGIAENGLLSSRGYLIETLMGEAARAALLDREFPAWSRRKIAEGRARFAALLDELGLPYTPSHGNFIFHRTGMPMAEYQAQMKAKGFLVGWPHAPVAGFEDWCRTSIGTDAEMTAHAVAMREVFAARLKPSANL